MEHLLKECIDKILKFTDTVDYQNKKQLNVYIAIYDKLKEINEIIDEPEIVGDIVQQRLEEYHLEKELIDKFGPSILAYLLLRNTN